MRLLVTGGAGFIGSNFIRHMLTTHDDYRIVNFDKLTYAGNLDNLTDISEDPRYTFVQGDITASYFRGEIADVINRDIGLNVTEYKFVESQVIGTRRILNSSRLKEPYIGGIRLIKPIGKGYIAVFVYIDKKKIQKSIKLGYGITKYEYVHIDKLKEFFKVKGRLDKATHYEKIINFANEVLSENY